MKILPIDPAFSSWVNGIRKVPIINFKFESYDFSTKSVFFVYLRSLLFSNCQLAMFCFSSHFSKTVDHFTYFTMTV